MQSFNNGLFHVNIIVEVYLIKENSFYFTYSNDLLFYIECGNVFCNSCASYYKLIPQLSLTRQVRVCRDCYPTIDDNNNNTNIEPSPPTTTPSTSTKSAAPVPIQNGCRQTNGTPNGSFNSAGGQKVKG